MMRIHTHFGGKDTGLDRTSVGLVVRPGIPPHAAYLNQTHSNQVVVISDLKQDISQPADAAVTRLPGLALTVKTADCAPVLLFDADAGVIAAVHSGWQGTLQNIIAPSIHAMVAQGAAHARIQGVIGPCLQQANFAVGFDVRDNFVAQNPAYAGFFMPSSTEAGKYLLDNTALILWQLQDCGVTQVTADLTCTVEQSDRYYSYRSRHIDTAHDTMRNVAMIWMD